MSHDCRRQHYVQRHVHELLGTVKLAKLLDDPHDHRFAGMSGQPIFFGESHMHKVRLKTDFYENHFHYIRVKTGPAIRIDEDHHVHALLDKTTVGDKHRHRFVDATLVNNPIGH